MELRIKELCKAKGILQKDLAEKIGITDIALRASLKGNPTLSTLEKVANALDVEVWELFTESTSKEELTALIQHKSDFYKANTLPELEKIVSDIRGKSKAD